MTGQTFKHHHQFTSSKWCLGLLLGTVCVVGDRLIDEANSRFYAALIDNVTHAIVAAIGTCIVVNEFRNRTSMNEKRFLIAGAFFAGAVMDVDHFVEAHTWHLSEATQLNHRPFMHCSNIPIIVLIVFILCVNFRSFRLNISLGMLFLAIATHQTRDAVRRGFWIRPFGDTPPIPYVLYVALSMGLPFAVIALMNAFQQHWDVRKKQYGESILNMV